jgi:hypothetical protein
MATLNARAPLLELTVGFAAGAAAVAGAAAGAGAAEVMLAKVTKPGTAPIRGLFCNVLAAALEPLAMSPHDGATATV